MRDTCISVGIAMVLFFSILILSHVLRFVMQVFS